MVTAAAVADDARLGRCVGEGAARLMLMLLGLRCVGWEPRLMFMMLGWVGALGWDSHG